MDEALDTIARGEYTPKLSIVEQAEANTSRTKKGETNFATLPLHEDRGMSLTTKTLF